MGRPGLRPSPSYLPRHAPWGKGPEQQVAALWSSGVSKGHTVGGVTKDVPMPLFLSLWTQHQMKPRDVRPAWSWGMRMGGDGEPGSSPGKLLGLGVPWTTYNDILIAWENAVSSQHRTCPVGTAPGWDTKTRVPHSVCLLTADWGRCPTLRTFRRGHGGVPQG